MSVGRKEIGLKGNKMSAQDTKMFNAMGEVRSQMPQQAEVIQNYLNDWFAKVAADNEMEKPITFKDGLRDLINRFSLENQSNTPDFILAEYLNDCLSSFDKAVTSRSIWYKKDDAVVYAAAENQPGQDIVQKNTKLNYEG